MKCPRRAESFVQHGDSEDSLRGDDTCSYCGSLNPDTLMQRLEAGNVTLGPTDKNYKVYVENAGGETFKQTYRDCYTQGAKDCRGPSECTHWVTRETAQTKFYFQHLSEEQKKRFVELLNEKKVKIGYPGYFYRLPFFCTREKPPAQSEGPDPKTGPLPD